LTVGAFTIIRGQCARRTTSSAMLPNKRCFSQERPCVPITIRSHPILSRISRMCWALGLLATCYLKLEVQDGQHTAFEPSHVVASSESSAPVPASDQRYDSNATPILPLQSRFCAEERGYGVGRNPLCFNVPKRGLEPPLPKRRPSKDRFAALFVTAFMSLGRETSRLVD